MSDELLRELRRIADALERIATQPSGTLPPRRGRVRTPRASEPAASEIDELTRERARRALRKAGLR